MGAGQRVHIKDLADGGQSAVKGFAIPRGHTAILRAHIQGDGALREHAAATQANQQDAGQCGSQAAVMSDCVHPALAPFVLRHDHLHDDSP